jgi:hypothetical protein
MNRLSQEVQATDEQVAKLSPVIHKFFQNRYNIAERNSAAEKAMDTATSDSERAEAQKTYDQTRRQAQNAERDFVAAVDPILTPTQQARFRKVQREFSRQALSLVDKAKETAQQQEEERLAQQAQRQQKQQEKAAKEKAAKQEQPAKQPGAGKR